MVEIIGKSEFNINNKIYFNSIYYVNVNNCFIGPCQSCKDIPVYTIEIIQCEQVVVPDKPLKPHE